MKLYSKTLFAALVAPAILAGCTSNGDNMAKVTTTDLLHHNWNLTQVDGNTVVEQEGEAVPRLEVGEKMSVNGNAGCNSFFGQAELKDGQFRVESMGMTMKMCAPTAMAIEQAVSATLTNWSEVSIDGQVLTLKGAEHTLVYQLADWVN